MALDPTSARQETREQRLDRNLTELLNELRVALPGVQVLFGFLLVAPFNQRFGTTDGLERGLYFAALVLTALAGVCLIAPPVHHRIQFRLQAKEDVVMMGNALAIAGLALLALAMNCVLLLVIDYLFGLILAVVTAVGVAAAFGGVWYLIPMRGRRGRRRPPGHYLQAK
ncbi:MAG: hypothetical protein J2P45_00810 [Candidatus Dormibacteraeota bacterium]|nr:hypothetical protein [Candidatus Dormibacteraeota bacterium]